MFTDKQDSPFVNILSIRNMLISSSTEYPVLCSDMSNHIAQQQYPSSCLYYI